MRRAILKLCLRAYPRARRARDGEALLDLASDLAEDNGTLREAASLLGGGLRARAADRTRISVSPQHRLRPTAGRVLVNMFLCVPVLWAMIAVTALIQDLAGAPDWDGWMLKGMFFGTAVALYYSPVAIVLLVVVETVGRRLASRKRLRRAVVILFAGLGAVLGVALVSTLALAGAVPMVIASALSGALYGGLGRLPPTGARPAEAAPR